MELRLLHFLALVLTALALVPGGAHVLEMPAKLALDRDAYITVQAIYRGWSWLGILTVGAPLVALVLALACRRRGRPAALPLFAFLLLAAVLGVFFTWAYPVNQATANWTAVPAEWMDLRDRWEWSHAASAGLTFLAFCTLAISALGRQH